MTREERKARQRAKKNLKKAARRMLIKQHGVDGGTLAGYPGIRKKILELRPDLDASGGWLILSSFTGLPAVPAKGEAKKQRKQDSQLQRRKSFEATDAFLGTYEWRRVRMSVLKRDGARCACCGATPADGVRMNVDHIKPRAIYPHLALDMGNLQVLCEVCNHGKGNWDMTDWRSPAEVDDAAKAHLRSIMGETDDRGRTLEQGSDDRKGRV